MSTVPDPASAPPRVALYARVSTEEQADRGTVENQRDFLTRYCDLYDLPIAGLYLDDGISGTLPLAARPDGKRLLADAAAGRFGTVLVQKVDRLGRSLAALLDAHQALEAHGVALKSATEPFDTSTAMGRFMFQLLSSMAELDRNSLLEKLTQGRDRHARNGRWLGVVPFGYDVDADGALVPSARLVPALDCTEAELVADLYRRLAAGSSLYAECARLNALGIPPVRRYPNGAVGGETKKWKPSAAWTPGRLGHTIRNPLYMGRHVYQSKHGPIERAVPALVDAALWQAVQRRLASNRKLSRTGTMRDYLLRGLIRCEACGASYAGAAARHRRADGTPTEQRMYRCNKRQARGAPRCPGRTLNADTLERDVWAYCRAFIRDPGPALAEAQAELRAQQSQVASHAAERAKLLQTLSEKDAERERTMTLYRRNLITFAEAEAQLAAVAREQAQLRGLLDALGSQEALAAAAEAQLVEAAAMLRRLHGRLVEIERTNDWTLKRTVVELLVREVRVQTEGTGRGKRAKVTARFAFGPAVAAVPASDWCTGTS